MLTTINLATRPYLELRPLLRRLKIAMGILVAVAIALGVGLHVVSARAAAEQAAYNAELARAQAFQQEKVRNEARMRQPQNAAVLERSRFLNELFARKSFSWTAVMMDLEQVLPNGVMVTAIEPNVASDGAVTIRLRVAGDRDRVVLLVRNLESSRRFLAPRLSSEAAQSKDQGSGSSQAFNAMPGGLPGGVEFEILAGYNPLPAGERHTKKTVETNDGPATPVALKKPNTMPLHPSTADAAANARATAAVNAKTRQTPLVPPVKTGGKP